MDYKTEASLVATESKSPYPEVVFQEFRHPEGKPLTKQYVRAEDGKPEKLPPAPPSRGLVSTHRKPFDEFVKFAVACGTDAFVMAATNNHGTNRNLVSRQIWDSLGSPKGLITREKAFHRFEPGQPGVFLVDHDFSESNPHQFDEPFDLWLLLCKVAPDVFGAGAWGSYYSSGSFIHDGEEVVTGQRGFHLAFPVLDSADIPRFRDVLFQRLILEGFGYVFMTRDGRCQVRAAFDKIAVQPQQPIFASGAFCEPNSGIEQRRPDHDVYPGAAINTRLLRDLSGEERREVKRTEQRLLDEAKAESESRRQEYIESEGAKLGLSHTQASRLIESRLEGRVTGDDILHFDNHRTVTVAEVLADPQAFHEKTLADPIEPEYGRGKAMLFYNQASGSVVINSHAHGGRTFTLGHSEKSLREMFQKLPPEEANETWPEHVDNANLRPDQEERFIDQTLCTVVSGGKVAIKNTLKSHKRRREEQNDRQEKLSDPALTLARLLLNYRYANGSWLIRTREGYFWRYNGKKWSQVPDRVLASELQKLAEDHFHELSTKHRQLPKITNLVNDAMATLAHEVMTDENDVLRLVSDPLPVINCANGTLWFEGGGIVLRPHRAKDYLTACSEVPYDPQAQAPTYEYLMRGILSHPGGAPIQDQNEVFDYLEEIFGYTLQPERFLKLFVLIGGPGDNGKTQLSRILERILGTDAIYPGSLKGVAPEGSNGKFGTYNLVGKLALVDDDYRKNDILDDGFLKKISERKLLAAQQKNKDEFNFVCNAVVFTLFNNWPRVKDVTPAMQRRAHVLWLTRQFYRTTEVPQGYEGDVRRPDLWDKVFKEEMPGVLARLVRAAVRLKQRGDLQVPESAKTAHATWMSHTQPELRFIQERCSPAAHPNIKGPTLVELHHELRLWGQEEGIPHHFMPTKMTLREKLQSHGFDIRMHRNRYVLFGYKLDPIFSQIQ